MPFTSFIGTGKPVIRVNINTTQTDVNIYSLAGSPSIPVHVILSINAPCRASATNTYAVDQGNFPSGSTMTVENFPGSPIYAKGGAGADGSTGFYDSEMDTCTVSGVADAEDGGTAVRITVPTDWELSDDVNGGGGGGGACEGGCIGTDGFQGAGGGGGQTAGTVKGGDRNGKDGSESSAGGGGSISESSNDGGNGGSFGQAGQDGEGANGISGGAAGFAFRVESSGSLDTSLNGGSINGGINNV